MIISDLSGTAATARTTTALPPSGTAAAKNAGAQAVSQENPQRDSVSLSPLASELKGDSLKVFSQLSTEDRTKLGSLVATGAMSAQEVGLALTSQLKQQRATTFWGEASKAVASLSGQAGAQSSGSLDISFDELSRASARRSAVKNSGMSGNEELNAMKQMQKEFFGNNKDLDSFESAKKSFGNLDTPYFMNAGDERYVQSDEEREAGRRLNELGFKSENFDSAISMLAQADVNEHMKENEKLLDKIKSGSAP